MKITSLLIASTAALASVSVAQAADAIVAAEPEPLEYVRVCDAFGTGYFYIPGTETCLKIGGYVRVQVDGRSGLDLEGAAGEPQSGYRTNTRGHLTVDAKSDTEFGTLASTITLEANTNNDDGFFLDETFIELGGLRVGYFYNYFDIGLPGETVLADGGPLGGDGADALFGGYIGGNTLNNSIRYTYEGGAFTAYGQVDFFDSQDGWKTDADGSADEIGINGLVAGKFGGVSIDLFGAYEFDNEDGVIASTLTAELGPGSLGIFGVYSFGPSAYWDFSEWSIGAEYEFAVNDKFKIAPGIQYWDNIVPTANDYTGGSAWRAGVTADYTITTNLTLKATVNYTDVDVDSTIGGVAVGDGDYWDGFLRLQRSF